MKNNKNNSEVENSKANERRRARNFLAGIALTTAVVVGGPAVISEGVEKIQKIAANPYDVDRDKAFKLREADPEAFNDKYIVITAGPDTRPDLLAREIVGPEEEKRNLSDALSSQIAPEDYKVDGPQSLEIVLDRGSLSDEQIERIEGLGE